MLEWLKRHAWKACGLQKGLASSNLALSAKGFAKSSAKPFCFLFFCGSPADWPLSRIKNQSVAEGLVTFHHIFFGDVSAR